MQCTEHGLEGQTDLHLNSHSAVYLAMWPWTNYLRFDNSAVNAEVPTSKDCIKIETNNVCKILSTMPGIHTVFDKY